MGKIHSIPVSNKVDIHAARMYTREVAREIGMDLITQARVSLGTSTLAHTLGMGEDRTGGEKIVIESVEKADSAANSSANSSQAQAGVRITFYTRLQRAPELVRADMREILAKDELEFQQLSTNQMKVTLVMWADNSLTNDMERR